MTLYKSMYCTVHTYRVTTLNVTRIWINRLFGPAQTVWQFLPFLVTFHAITRYIFPYVHSDSGENERKFYRSLSAGSRFKSTSARYTSLADARCNLMPSLCSARAPRKPQERWLGRCLHETMLSQSSEKHRGRGFVRLALDRCIKNEL